LAATRFPGQGINGAALRPRPDTNLETPDSMQISKREPGPFGVASYQGIAFRRAVKTVASKTRLGSCSDLANHQQQIAHD
jgi:hypothetical protein